MKRISLISNSSIQYYKFEAAINYEFSKLNKLYFHQPFDSSLLDFIYDPVFKWGKNEEEKYFRQFELIEKGILINNRILDESNLLNCEQIDNFYEINNLKKSLKGYQKKWIPMPFFKHNSINKNIITPTDWVRVFFDCNEDFTKVSIVLAIDTTLAKNENDLTSPQLSLNPDENIYKLNNEETNICTYLFDSSNSNKWIESYLSESFYGNNEELIYEKPEKQFIAYYIILLKWLSSLNEMPEFQLFSDEKNKIPVDLVIDIGNSATCALLFENQNDDFTFDKVKKLKIQDYSNPKKEYDKPFPMNLVFAEPNFGNLNKENYHNNKFVLPSFVRIGYEAENLIQKSSNNLDFGYELKVFNSSPKRYMWDTEAAETEWEFFPYGNGKIKKVYVNGISEQLKIDGSLANGDLFGQKALYSKSSLMKFVFLEMLIHAYIQINSYDFRISHGNILIPRTLKRITISCPTAMIQFEQIALRQAAEDACKLLNNYVKIYFESDDNKFWFELPEIVPSIRDLCKKLPDIEYRNDWIYDEATSSQFVFIYGLLNKKIKNNQYVINNYLLKNKNHITVGSIDIGAGTTDIMVANYSIKTENKGIEIEPNPEFWDSFKTAGDDMLKEIIQQIIIEGNIENENDKNCCGIIKNYAIKNNINDISQKINSFFGADTNSTSYKIKSMRKAFVHQIAIPIALHYLENANENEIKTKNIEEIIGSEYKNKELLVFFKQHFGFDLLDLKWEINPNKINSIINSVFENLLKQTSYIFNLYKCDYIILSGKPGNLNTIERLLLKYIEISPSKFINLNKAWIGKWYPFSDSRGYVEDSKTLVSVGATIALMGGKLNKLKDFKINTIQLRKKLISTANYIVKIDYANKDVILDTKKNEKTIIANSLPYQLEYSRFSTKNYPSSKLNSISIDSNGILNYLKNKYPNKPIDFYYDQLELEKGKIFKNYPLKINLTREYDESKEEIKIESIEDNEGNNKPVKFFKINYQTLTNEKGYWLDTCEFILNNK
jgi:hypothetical protein